MDFSSAKKRDRYNDESDEIHKHKRLRGGEMKLHERSRSNSFEDETKLLPIFAHKNELIKQINEHKVIVLAGETGCGKSTQIPKYLYDTYPNKRIAITQPRRVAAISLARRVSSELGNLKLGEEVGYTVRFDDKSSSKTRIKFMTDGILVREALRDPKLSQYGFVMLDEAHERSIHTDILFGLIRGLLDKRRDLKLIVTSATLNTEKFSKFFGDCPIINVPGRTFPVDIFHAKQKVNSTNRGRLWEKATEIVRKIQLKEPTNSGDVLVFLPGFRDIELAQSALLKDNDEVFDNALMIVPLYGALPSEKQEIIFRNTPNGCRKIVLATNIAETSLTVPGVRYVVDPGYVKQRVYRGDTGLNTLSVVQISKTSAQQRAGRAGRVSSGKCFRLYPKIVYEDDMPNETIPEIQRSNLSNTVLYLKVLGIADILQFPFLDPPSEAALLDALSMLYYLEALDSDGNITSLGRRMSNFPLEPCLSKMLIVASELNCLTEATVIAAMISVETIYYKSPQKSQQYSTTTSSSNTFTKCQNLFNKYGDHLSYISVFRAFISHGCSREWCKEYGLHYRALNSAKNIQKQLNDILGKDPEIKSVKKSEESSNFEDKIVRDSIRKALCSGFFVNSAAKCLTSTYKTLADGDNPQLAFLHPTGVLALTDTTGVSLPSYVIYHELVHTTKPFLKHTTAVKKSWLIPYLQRINDVDLNRLTHGKINPNLHGDRWKREKDSSKKRVNKNRNDGAAMCSNSNLTSTGTNNNDNMSRSDKIAAARARFLARKQI